TERRDRNPLPAAASAWSAAVSPRLARARQLPRRRSASTITTVTATVTAASAAPVMAVRTINAIPDRSRRQKPDRSVTCFPRSFCLGELCGFGDLCGLGGLVGLVGLGVG